MQPSRSGILFTSGTSGRAKGASDPRRIRFAARRAGALALRPDDVVLGAAPSRMSSDSPPGSGTLSAGCRLRSSSAYADPTPGS
jgi:hypothetical protein